MSAATPTVPPCNLALPTLLCLSGCTQAWNDFKDGVIEEEDVCPWHTHSLTRAKLHYNLHFTLQNRRTAEQLLLLGFRPTESSIG